MVGETLGRLRVKFYAISPVYKISYAQGCFQKHWYVSISLGRFEHTLLHVLRRMICHKVLFITEENNAAA